MLLITLALIALTTVVVVAYFSRTTTNRRIDSATSGATRADILARAMAQTILSDIKMEIVGGSTVTQPTDQMPIYAPASTESVVPTRVLADASMSTNATFNNLVKQSSSRFFPSDYSTTPLIVDSTRRDTSIPSANKRIIGAARWNAPVLNAGGGFSASAQLPQWILVTRQGIAANQSWSTALKNYDTSNSQAVIGRFAFNIYDTGGLLDANVAGLPIFSGLPPTADKIQQLKSTQAGAQFYDTSGPIIPGFDSTVENAFVNLWKYGTTATSVNNFLLDFMSRTTLPTSATGPTFADSGFMRPTIRSSDSNTFAYSRQDLLRLTSASGGYLTAASLPYFSHFTRELNAPSWSPTTPAGSSIDYAVNADLTSSANRRVPNVRVTASFTRAVDGATAVVGEPLIKYRFPLRRIDAIGTSGVNAAGFPVMSNGGLISPTATTVQRDFGLIWDSANSRWSYVGANGSNPTNPQTAIATLAEAASAEREPNFFEILKAFILSGSIGLGSGASPTFVVAEPRYYQQPQSSDAQIIQIGANIIDQWDTDKFPIFIYFNGIEFAGIENLPYLQKVIFQPRWDTSLTPAQFKAWILPGYWFCGQNGTTLGTGATIPTARFIMTGGTMSAAVVANGTTIASTNSITGTTTQPSAQVNAGSTYGPTPNTPAVPNAFANAPYVGMAQAPNSKLGLQFDFPTSSGITASNIARTYPIINGATFEMQVQMSNGAWKAYQKWNACSVNASSVTAACEPASGFNWTSASIYDPEFVVLDPKTMRFGAWETNGLASGDSTDFTRGFNETLDRSGGMQLVTSLGPQGPSSFLGIGAKFQGAQIANNSGSPGYKDLDSVQRKGDVISSAQTSAVLPTNSADRAPLLSRQARTVAELGTVSRDQPWKTLNFSTGDSADAGLLDAFSIFELNSVFRSDLVAGKLSLNTRQSAVLRAVLNGVTKSTTDTTGTTNITTAERDAIADALIAMTSAQPMVNKSELVTRFGADPSMTALGSKEKREAVIRALSDVGQTRTWNLMIDVIAQVGKYGTAASSVDDFIVQGEKRYWLHIAIDRFTGAVIDQQLETVHE